MYDKAIYCWQRTLDLDETHPDVHVRIAEALWSKGDLEQARQHYLIGLRENPGETSTLLDLGDLLMDMQRLDEAGEKFRNAIELAPEHPAGFFCYGRWLAEAGRDAEATAAFEKALRLDPTFPEAHLQLGRLHQKNHDLDKARKHLRAELMLHPDDSQTLLELANRLLDVGENRAATACLKRLVQIDANNASAWQNLAVAYFARSRYEQGIECCRAAHERDPENLMVIYNLALAHEHLRKYDEALVWTRRGLERDPKDPSLQRLEVRLRFLRFRSRFIRIVKALLKFGN
jgi:tetratricopeptide (TPR) repeat protein